MSIARKIGFLALGAILIVMGVIGLILPILPGVLLLLAAIYVISKASTRVRRWADANPHFRAQRQRFRHFEQLKPLDQVRLTGWMMLDALVQGMQLLADAAARLGHALRGRANGA